MDVLCLPTLFPAIEWSFRTDCSSGEVIPPPLVAWNFKVHAFHTFWLPLCDTTTGLIVDTERCTVQYWHIIVLSAEGLGSKCFNPNVQMFLTSAAVDSMVLLTNWADLWFFYKNVCKDIRNVMLRSLTFSLVLLTAVLGKVWISLFHFSLSLPVYRGVSVPKASFEWRLVSWCVWGAFLCWSFYSQVFRRAELNIHYHAVAWPLLHRWSLYWTFLFLF